SSSHAPLAPLHLLMLPHLNLFSRICSIADTPGHKSRRKKHQNEQTNHRAIASSTFPICPRGVKADPEGSARPPSTRGARARRPWRPRPTKLTPPPSSSTRRLVPRPATPPPPLLGRRRCRCPAAVARTRPAVRRPPPSSTLRPGRQPQRRSMRRSQ
ncbi:hypothetical protein BRADI_3g19233v3, partial [Brachypodium distachyon]